MDVLTDQRVAGLEGDEEIAGDIRFANLRLELN